MNDECGMMNEGKRPTRSMMNEENDRFAYHLLPITVRSSFIIHHSAFGLYSYLRA
jgi:hypothetical protein